MNCVYTAFSDHMKAIGELEYGTVFDAYLRFKAKTHGPKPQNTFAGIIPWLYNQMLFQHNLLSTDRIEMKIERSYLDLAEYMQEATEVQQRTMLFQTSYYGQWVDEISLSPAIYCMLNEQHAMYAEEIPAWKGARILFAVQLIRMEK